MTQLSSFTNELAMTLKFNSGFGKQTQGTQLPHLVESEVPKQRQRVFWEEMKHFDFNNEVAGNTSHAFELV